MNNDNLTRLDLLKSKEIAVYIIIYIQIYTNNWKFLGNKIFNLD